MTSPRTRGRAARWMAGCAVGLGLAATPFLVPSSGAGALDVAEARASLAQATAVRERAELRLAQLEIERAELRARLERASAEVGAITSQIVDAARTARARAIEAYISGGAIEQISAVLDSSGASDASARTAILSNQADEAAAAAYQLQKLKEDNDPEVVTLAERIEGLERRIQQATSDVSQAAALEADAERALAAAETAAVERERRKAETKALAAGRAVARPVPSRAAAPSPSSAETDMERRWARLRDCESGGDYGIVSRSGRYRGAYQFDQRTWESVGGRGDPAQASPEEQDMRARMLYQQRGARAWPHCGRYLRG
jgi:hypothetical protein